MLAHTLGCRRLDLYLDRDRPLQESERAPFRVLMRRRGEAREPLAYITGARGFRGLDLIVGPGALIPRPETEHLVEVGLSELERIGQARDGDPLVFCDVGTGSGCVALAVVAERGGVRGLGIDRSPEALTVAQRNVAALDPAGRVSLLRADLLEPLAPDSLDLVLSNPPYVTPEEESLLAPEILRHEPRQALFDAPGLPLTQALVRQARRVLRPGGALALETGFDKAALVADLLREAGFEQVRATRDLGDVERVLSGRLPEGPLPM